MEESTSREKVLKRIRNGLIDAAENPYPNLSFETSVYEEINEPLDVLFAQEFTKVSGKFVYCENEDEFVGNLGALVAENKWGPVICMEEKLKGLLEEASIEYSSDEHDLLAGKVGITFCEYLIARLGSVMVSSKFPSGRRLNVYPEIHLVVAYSSQLVPDLKNAFKGMNERYGKKLPSMISVITGPSRTADIEKTLVMGAHGPKELYVFLIDENVD